MATTIPTPTWTMLNSFLGESLASHDICRIQVVMDFVMLGRAGFPMKRYMLQSGKR